ncbi:MAG: hypothetical protein Q8868_06705 [Bacteroidota bacterium]|nr:hypothetical protein [Bacteroidota bacterium]
MKTLIINRLAVMLALIMLIPGCKKNKNEVSPFVGNYVIANAELSQAINVPTVEAGTVPIPVGTNITPLIQQALLSAVTCSSPDKSYVELRNDFSLYISCEGANPLNGGTWQELSNTSILLNLNSTAVPSSPIGLSLTVTAIVKDASKLTGTTSVPLPKAMVAGLLTAMHLTLSPSAPDIFLATFSIEFTVK